MIEFFSQTNFKIQDPESLIFWISEIISQENHKLGDLSYVFCDDDYLHNLNVKFLNHDTLTDIISFDYSVGNNLQGDIYISVERVADNAKDFKVSFTEEMHRVLIHGILHYCGFKDKSDEEAKLMRSMENEALSLWLNK